MATVLFSTLLLSAYGQVDKRKNYIPIWTFHQRHINIHGISLGLWSFNYNSQPRYTHTNGLKLELIGLGFGMPLISKSPVVESDSEFTELRSIPLSERINGINLSTTGTVCHCLTNGVTAGLIGQIHFQVNGVAASLLMNVSQKHHGVMVAMTNDAYVMHGLQVGISNNTYLGKGLQAGAFNSNLDKMKGIQMGIINKARHIEGFQVGLWNVNQKRKLPFFNWHFP
jgi:hypothetical protein